MTLELTNEQIEELAEKIFNKSFSDSEYSHKWEDCDGFVKNDWINTAWDAVEGYNIIVEYMDVPNVSVMKDCCLTCKHVDLCRPACNLRGDDIALDCVCSKFKLIEFEEDDED